MIAETDVLDDLDKAVRKQDLEEKGAKAISTARAKLVLGKDAPSAFFATLSLGLELEADWTVDTAATDGKKLIYNPEWFANLPLDQAKGVVSHEVLHISNKHHVRMGDRNPQKWNIAADLAINPIIKEAGQVLPPGGLFPGTRPPRGSFPDNIADAIASMTPGLSAEEYYSLLPDPPQGKKGQGQDPGGCGGIRPPGTKPRPGQDGSQPVPCDPAAAREAEADADVKTAQAKQAAKLRGNMPAGMSRMLDEVLQPKVDWKDVLRDFISKWARNDYAWSPPNRRYIWQGLYLPGLRSEELGDVIVLVDTSGSIGAKELNTFGGELQGILEAYTCNVHIIYHDSRVAGTQEWCSTDGPLVMQPKGGGGTSHVDALEYGEKNWPEAACIVCLTDLYTSFPSTPPAIPVLWAVVGNSNPTAPFGQVVKVER